MSGELCTCETCTIIRAIPKQVRVWIHSALYSIHPHLSNEAGNKLVDLADTIRMAETRTTRT